MDNTIVRRYRQERRKGMGAQHALAYAKYLRKYSAFDWWQADWRNASVELPQGNGYVAHVRIVRDDDADLSYLGRFTSRHSDGAIKHDGGRNSYEWFQPAVAEAEHYTALRARYYGRAEARRLAREYVQRDYRRACDYGNGWGFIGVTVEIHKAGVELASGALFGIESDSDKAYLEQTARDIIPELMEEAQARAESLARKLVA